MQDNYDRLMFREAVKSGAYDLGNARDAYRCAKQEHPVVALFPPAPSTGGSVQLTIGARVRESGLREVQVCLKAAAPLSLLLHCLFVCRLACGPEGMNKELIRRYIEVSSLCPLSCVFVCMRACLCLSVCVCVCVCVGVEARITVSLDVFCMYQHAPCISMR